MPYIAIKCYPKDKETKETVIKKINELLLEHWGCSQQAISISLEEIPKEEWEEKMAKGEMEKAKDNMIMLSGERVKEF